MTRRAGLIRGGSRIIPSDISESSLLWACSDGLSAYPGSLANAHFIKANIAEVSRMLIIRPPAQLGA
ncbi:hypothetical protein SAMN05421819_1236 [Bryocella elongata]|uniref:Uncharacterized protein n=1 Tax=Bryocella elongata TaxID=863522 RepID=A0A1H5UWK2_9BACT|nr:hypothetical protein SAMN05421819_1236 [Bryocella elongata]